MAWCVYNTIGLRQSGDSVADGLRELFGQHVYRGLSNHLKSRSATFYAPAYSYLKDKVRSSQVVHADETPMKIKENAGYVWVFSTMEEVVYVYSSTREGTLVKEILAGFSGILVSDFYAAYDSIECGQQKCLIHLIRDINSDLFRNPFDQELKELARAMTNVMVPIVETIDKYGLKKRHLGKFTKNANTFLDTIANRQFDSELAQGFQRRITKYCDKLFLFLNHDNVAWNNNNAEQAIKRFAILRRIIGGASTEKGVQEYLVLLSICETLRRKNLSFLGFLLSQSTDLHDFIENA